MLVEPPRSEPRLSTKDSFARVSPTHGRGRPISHPPSVASTAAVSATPPEVPARHQLDPDGYPTHTLYYLHKRMLDITANPEIHRPKFDAGTPTVSSPSTPPGTKGFPNPNNSLELSYEPNKEDQTLHDLYEMLSSPDYILPPSPPFGASPCNTPPRFELTIKREGQDQHASHVARILASYDVLDIEAQMLELEIEAQCERRACPSSVAKGIEPEISRKSLFEEMQAVGARTPCMAWGVGGWKDEGWAQVQGIAI